MRTTTTNYSSWLPLACTGRRLCQGCDNWVQQHQDDCPVCMLPVPHDTQATGDDGMLELCESLDLCRIE